MFTINARWQRLLDWYIFLHVAGYFAWTTWKHVDFGRLDMVEGLFLLHNVLVCCAFVWRKPARAIQSRLLHQLIALCAFYSGVLFIGPASTVNPVLLQAAWWLTVGGTLLGIASLVQLGPSFGVLIALREVRDRGVYACVRHPMYVSDIVMRLGYFCSHATWPVFWLLLVSSACYVYRAILEERFMLTQNAGYAEYSRKVPFRFVPGVF